ncbi:MAG: hypothetical protein AAGA91_19370, partial [Pseudomonadota bacterium]
MSHLLYLIFRNISHTSAHTSVFINLLNSFNYRSGSEKRPGNDPTEDAHYTYRPEPCKSLEKIIQGFFPLSPTALSYRPDRCHLESSGAPK